MKVNKCRHRRPQWFSNNFHPLEVVGRGSKTQLQVGENLTLFRHHSVSPICTFMSFFWKNKTKQGLNNLVEW